MGMTGVSGFPADVIMAWHGMMVKQDGRKRGASNEDDDMTAMLGSSVWHRLTHSEWQRLRFISWRVVRKVAMAAARRGFTG
jgi:hypothetical protein